MAAVKTFWQQSLLLRSHKQHLRQLLLLWVQCNCCQTLWWSNSRNSQACLSVTLKPQHNSSMSINSIMILVTRGPPGALQCLTQLLLLDGPLQVAQQ